MATAANQVLVSRLYKGIIEDVISGMRNTFLDEGVDEAVLQKLKQMWETKLMASKAVEPVADPAKTALQGRVQHGQANAAANRAKQSAGPAPQPAVSAPASAFASDVPMVPVVIKLAAKAGVVNSVGKSITVQVPAHAAGGALLKDMLSSPSVTAALSLPVPMATMVMQHHINAALGTEAAQAARVASVDNNSGVIQSDGANDSSSDDHDSDDDYHDDDNKHQEENAAKDDDLFNEDNDRNLDEETINSDDEASDGDPSDDPFEADNIVVCQFIKVGNSKITSKNEETGKTCKLQLKDGMMNINEDGKKWKFQLKDGIMNIDGRDYVFHQANGNATW